MDFYFQMALESSPLYGSKFASLKLLVYSVPPPVATQNKSAPLAPEQLLVKVTSGHVFPLLPPQTSILDSSSLVLSKTFQPTKDLGGTLASWKKKQKNKKTQHLAWN